VTYFAVHRGTHGSVSLDCAFWESDAAVCLIPTSIKCSGRTRLDAALPLADFVLLAAPLTAETKLLMDERRIRLIKPGAGFINIGRAGLADNAALVRAFARRQVVRHAAPPPHSLTPRASR
jgi:hypothetical protein